MASGRGDPHASGDRSVDAVILIGTPKLPMDPGEPEPLLKFGFFLAGLEEGLPADGFVGPYRLLERIGEGGR